MSDAAGEFHHVPVLLAEALEWLTPALSGSGPLVDCTVGGAGHTEAFLRALPELVVLGIDRDQEAVDAARLRLSGFGGRAVIVKANFDQITSVVRSYGYEQVQAVFYDLGVSSPQLDRAYRGFQYRPGVALDMRMDRSSSLEAGQIVNHYSVNELIDLLRRHSQERFAPRIARAIVSRREKRPFEDAGDLAEVVKQAIPAATRRTGGHPARRTFQALRMQVNQEPEALRASLDAAVDLLSPGGRLAAISYHSGEDIAVKDVLTKHAQGCICPKDLPVCVCGRTPALKILTRKPIRPSSEEMQVNPRSDSAKMRVAEKMKAV